jgi:RNA polymerase sigma factor (TIGR02999 family)
MTDPDAITRFLQNEPLHEPETQERLYALVYDHLRGLARQLLAGERKNHTFAATDLVHEGFFKLRDLEAIQWENRSHFYKVSVRAMKQILIDYARRRQSLKRGGGAENVSLDEAGALASTEQAIEDLISLYDALQAYARFDPKGRGKKIIEYVYFQGMTHPEIAERLGVTTKTVQRDLRLAEAWLKRYFAQTSSHEEPPGASTGRDSA